MTQEEFRAGIEILQAGIGRKYRDDNLAFWWESLKFRFAGHFLSVCRELAKTEQHLPTLATFFERLDSASHPEKEKEKKQRGEQAYYERQKELAEEAEKITGASFQSFLDLNQGDHTSASLYFGKADWNARGETRYDRHYDGLIEKREELLQHPQTAGEKRKKERQKGIVERMKVGEALDATEGYAKPPEPAVSVEAPAPPPPEPYHPTDDLPF